MQTLRQAITKFRIFLESSLIYSSFDVGPGCWPFFRLSTPIKWRFTISSNETWTITNCRMFFFSLAIEVNCNRQLFPINDQTKQQQQNNNQSITNWIENGNKSTRNRETKHGNFGKCSISRNCTNDSIRLISQWIAKIVKKKDDAVDGCFVIYGSRIFHTIDKQQNQRTVLDLKESRVHNSYPVYRCYQKKKRINCGKIRKQWP